MTTIPLIRILRCGHYDVPPGSIGVIVGLHADGLAVAVEADVRDASYSTTTRKTIVVYVERDDIVPHVAPPPVNGNGQHLLPLAP